MKSRSVFCKAMLAVTICLGWGAAQVATAADGVFEVVYPSGRSTVAKQQPAPRLDTLEGKTICELWNYMFNGEHTFPIIEEQLKARYPGVKFVSYDVFGTIHSATEARDVAALPEKLRAAGCDAVIAGNGC